MDSTPSWYIAQDGQPIGPFTAEEVLARAREGSLLPNQLVWHPDFGSDWREAGTVDGLAPAFPVVSRARIGTAGTTPNRELVRHARAALAGQWAKLIGITIVFSFVIFALGLALEWVVTPLTAFVMWVLMVPLEIGWRRVLLNAADRQPLHVKDLFSGFSRLGAGLVAKILIQILLVLWAVAILLPAVLALGVIVVVRQGRFTPTQVLDGPTALAAILIGVGALVAMFGAVLRYVLAMWLIADDPAVGPLEAIRRSVNMMQGRKWKFVGFVLRFSGWALLAMLTCGVGFFVLAPYMGSAMALWYRDALPPEM